MDEKKEEQKPQTDEQIYLECLRLAIESAQGQPNITARHIDERAKLFYETMKRTIRFNA